MTDPYTTPYAKSSALITIDTQNDFTLPNAPAQIAGTAEVIPAMTMMLDAYRAAGRPIFHVIRLYKENGSNVDACRRHAIERGTSYARPSTNGAELVSELKANPSIRLDAEHLLNGELQPIGDNEWILYKSRWSAFHQTQLNATLRQLGVDTLVFTGCNFPNCPRSTIYDASNHDFRIVVVIDAMSGLYDKAIHELAGIGAFTMTTAETVEWFGKTSVKRHQP